MCRTGDVLHQVILFIRLSEETSLKELGVHGGADACVLANRYIYTEYGFVWVCSLCMPVTRRGQTPRLPPADAGATFASEGQLV